MCVVNLKKKYYINMLQRYYINMMNELTCVLQLITLSLAILNNTQDLYTSV